MRMVISEMRNSGYNFELLVKFCDDNAITYDWEKEI
jgi:hypothetical protein